MSTHPPLLEARGLGRHSTAASGWLLRDVSFELHGGDCAALVGPSGSGKTLLLRALAMIDPVDAGVVVWQGQTAAGHAVPVFRSQVMYVHQRPALVEGTVEDNLRRPFQLAVHRHKRFCLDRARGMLELVGRDHAFLAKQQHDLSGGEAQLVALVRALQLDPQVLLLDEPTAALDHETAASVERWLSSWRTEPGSVRAQLWVTHDSAQANRIAGSILELYQGHLRRPQCNPPMSS